MITRIGSLFAGNVDLDNIGLEGTPANDRWLTDTQLASVFEKCQAICEVMDLLGYSTFWSAEHHFQREGYECVPNLLMLFLHLSHLTRRLKFGCGFNIAPMWHPLRLAEDYAMADILTDGRVIFGVGLGYHTREVETFDAPLLDQDANRELFEEQVELMFKAFNQRSFSHQGKYYNIPPRVPYRGYELEELTLVPRPGHLPVECWQPIVSASPRALDFMAKHGIKGMIGGGAASGGASDEVVKRWQEALAKCGRETELGGDLIISYSVQIADTQQKAIDQARPWVEERIKMFGPLGFVPGLTPQQLEALGDPRRARGAGLPTIEDGVRSGSWFCGPPEQVTEQILEIQDRYPGLEEINIGVTNMGMPLKATLEQLEWFGREVLPRFTAQAKAPAPAD
jgi:alkanesulfonate monooxygenase SsuD/methylene tetrahydromethanopterin reductase-like flavin-dependent oxidoreductase (luciferase family)